MAIDQRHFAETATQCIQLIRHEPMVWAVDFIEAPIEFRPIDLAAPKAPMPVSPGGNKTEPVARSGPDGCRRNGLYRRGIELLLSAIAINDSARDVLDNGSEPGPDRSPAQAVNQRILECFQCPPPLCGIGENSGVIFAAGMGHR